jgi:hypothetical protein
MIPVRLSSESLRNAPDSGSNSPLSRITPAQIATAAGLVAQYIQAQRAKYQPLARGMSTVLRRRVEGFFADELLENAAVCVLAKDRVEDPPFYPYLTGLGFTNLPAFSGMAITFVDVVVTYEKLNRSVLFHELVHTVQYRHLGVANFARLYVQGLVQGGSYEFIPLERHARELEQRFVLHPSGIFSVETEVRRWIEQQTF